MFDGPLRLWVNWPVVDTIHPSSNMFAAGVKIKATGELKCNDCPDGKSQIYMDLNSTMESKCDSHSQVMPA